MSFSERLRDMGFLLGGEAWINGVHYPDGTLPPADPNIDWVQSAQDAIFARLHRGDNPACDCGASDD